MGDNTHIKKITASEYVVFVYDGLGKLIGEYSADGPPQAPMVQYTATDPLGSPRVLTNELGEIVSRRDFMPFGEEVAADQTYRTAAHKYGVGDGVRQKFTGYERDDETGLDFAEARYYYNNHGRFTAVDPLLASGRSADPQTFNRYAYVMNRPLILNDPTGLQALQVPKLVVTVADRNPPQRKTYPVTGNSDVEAWNNASIEGPKTHGGSKAGRYDGRFDVRPTSAPGTFYENDDGTFTATVTVRSVEISIVDSYWVPDWQNMNDSDVTDQDRNEWRTELDSLEKHEIGHADILTAGVNDILKPALEQVTAPTGTGTGKSGQEAIDKATQNAVDAHIKPVLNMAEMKIQEMHDKFDSVNPNKRTN
jgi:RHS repeat-associated protein